MNNKNFFNNILLTSLTHPQLHENEAYIISLIKEQNINVNELVDFSLNENKKHLYELSHCMPKFLINKKTFSLLEKSGLNATNDLKTIMLFAIINQWNELKKEELQPLKDSLFMFEKCLYDPLYLVKEVKYSWSNSMTPLYELVKTAKLDLLECALPKLDKAIELLPEESAQLTKQLIKNNLLRSVAIHNYDGRSAPKLVRLLQESNFYNFEHPNNRKYFLEKIYSDSHPSKNTQMFNTLRGIFFSKIGKKYFTSNEFVDFIFDTNHTIHHDYHHINMNFMAEFSKSYKQLEKETLDYDKLLNYLNLVFTQKTNKLNIHDNNHLLQEVEKDKLETHIFSYNGITKNKVKI